MRSDNNQEDYKKQCEDNFKDCKFCPMRFEHQMDVLFNRITNDFSDSDDVSVLDACCGYGRLLYYMIQRFPSWSYTGLDYSSVLIDDATARFKEYDNVTFACCDLMNDQQNSYSKTFEISISYKTLSYLPSYESMIDFLIKATKNRIYITSLFQDSDMDIICKLYGNASRNNSFSYLNTYSFKKFKKFCEDNGAKSVNTIDIKIPFNLGSPSDINSDIPKTYTIRSNDDEILEFTSIISLRWKLVEILL
ncbi:MAG: class I SAM-dependent methyltransferase [Holosporaceae bacterium]|jgi:SAM-dependent methyltransferase|nr:class I SAM-dependent methyltransferase [Holosporaceae bacterium]